ncbi:MAG TPA: caspase family protein [Nostoc sp.]|uniref:caspase, EACC1-associated type n=1 Tax=Nostoc sp. TaxID=1180 RepID=UPI002D301C12|nr:caspase family protein [Nostoc sp.]HYX18221.1 caspase family protein [Nostoc sp.]
MVKVALLIGVSEYEPGLNPLPGAVKDVEAMQQVLLHSEMGGFTETDIMVLKNPQRQDMEEAIENLFAHRQKDDLLVLFFSGHGIKDDTGRLFLATRTTRKTPRGDLIRSSAVAASVVHESMSRSRSKRQVVILDSCFSGAFAEGLSAKDDGSVNIREQLGGEGRAVLTSSSSTQYSFEQQGSDLSIYTRYLIEGITTGAADLDEDGVVSIDELHEYASQKVREIQPTMRPEIYTSREGFKIRLTKVPQGDPKQKYRKEVARYNNRGEVSFVGRKILDALRNRLGLSEVEATAIEDEMLAVTRQEFQEKLQRYERDFSEALQQQVALSEDDLNMLRQNLQQILGLRNEDTMPIEAQVKAIIEAYKQKMQYYEQALAEAMQREYPLSQAAHDRLQNMQRIWKLSDKDIASLESRVTAEIEAYQQKLQQYEQAFIIATQQQYPVGEAKRHELLQEQQNLSLKDEDVASIEARITAEVETYLQKLQQYKQAFIKATQQQYPLSATQRHQLRNEQQMLNLKNEDTAAIEARITVDIKASLQKLQQYEQVFTRATQQQYPLSKTQRNQLRQEQQILGLKDENIALIETRIKVEIEAYLQKLQQYEQALIQTIQHEYPFSDEIREELKRYQQVLELGDEEVARIQDKVVREKQTHQSQTQQLGTSKLPEIPTQSSIFSSQLVPNQKTQVIPDTELPKSRQSPLQWIVPLIFVVAAGVLGLFVNQLRLRSPLVPLISSTPIPTSNPTIKATPIQRSLANLSPGWVIKTNNSITLGNNQSLPPGAFLQVINTKPNPKPASGNFSVSMRVCANKSTQAPANTNNPAVTSSVPSKSKPLPETVLLDLSQLKRLGVSVLPEDAPSPCTPVTQPPVTQPSDDSSPT